MSEERGIKSYGLNKESPLYKHALKRSEELVGSPLDIVTRVGKLPAQLVAGTAEGLVGMVNNLDAVARRAQYNLQRGQLDEQDVRNALEYAMLIEGGARSVPVEHAGGIASIGKGKLTDILRKAEKAASGKEAKAYKILRESVEKVPQKALDDIADVQFVDYKKKSPERNPETLAAAVYDREKQSTLRLNTEKLKRAEPRDLKQLEGTVGHEAAHATQYRFRKEADEAIEILSFMEENGLGKPQNYDELIEKIKRGSRAKMMYEGNTMMKDKVARLTEEGADYKTIYGNYKVSPQEVFARTMSRQLDNYYMKHGKPMPDSIYSLAADKLQKEIIKEWHMKSPKSYGRAKKQTSSDYNFQKEFNLPSDTTPTLNLSNLKKAEQEIKNELDTIRNSILNQLK